MFTVHYEVCLFICEFYFLFPFPSRPTFPLSSKELGNNTLLTISQNPELGLTQKLKKAIKSDEA